MLLYHVSPGVNDASIEAEGIDPACSQGARERTWLVTAARLHWAIWHVTNRHASARDGITVYTCRVPRSWLRRFRRGVWTTDRVILRDMYCGERINDDNL